MNYLRYNFNSHSRKGMDKEWKLQLLFGRIMLRQLQRMQHELLQKRKEMKKDIRSNLILRMSLIVC